MAAQKALVKADYCSMPERQTHDMVTQVTPTTATTLEKEYCTKSERMGSCTELSTCSQKLGSLT